MFSLKNFMKHPLTTLGGALVGTLQAGVTSAVIAFTQGGDISDWKPYAAAAASGAATFILGGLLPSGNSNASTEVASGETFISAPYVPPSSLPNGMDAVVNQFLLNSLTNRLGLAEKRGDEVTLVDCPLDVDDSARM